MTVVAGKGALGSWRGAARQAFMVLLMNVPTVSFGLAVGWVSLASGDGAAAERDKGGEEAAARQTQVAVAAVATFAALLVGVPLTGAALLCGRKFAVVCTSLAFVGCWALKLVGDGWWLVAARLVAGLGGAGAWTVAPLLAREMCSERAGGAAVAALVPAHNLGMLLMYCAADAELPYRTVLWCCLGLSACHCVVFLFVPESPSYLAAHGKTEEARAALAWLRGVDGKESSADLEREVAALPPPDDDVLSPLALTKDLLSSAQRRRAFFVAATAVVGQEMCGGLALVQFAQPLLAMAGAGSLAARCAAVLGAVQLVASLAALYLVERVGRRPLLVWSALVAGVGMAAACALVDVQGAALWTAAVLALVVAADSVGLMPAPYALLADMFTYQYRGCALALVTLGASVGCLADTALFPLVAAAGGASASLGLAAALTLAYAAFAVFAVPETRGLSVDEIYLRLGPKPQADEEAPHCTKM